MSIQSLIWQRRIAWVVIVAAVIALAQLKLDSGGMLVAALGIGAAVVYAVVLGIRIRRLRPPATRENPLWLVALLALVVPVFDLATLIPIFSGTLVVFALLYYGPRTLAAMRNRPLMKMRLQKGVVVLAIGLAAGFSVRLMNQRDDQAADDVVQAIQRYKLARGSYPAVLNMLTPEFLPAGTWERNSIKYYPDWSTGPVLISSKMFRRRTFSFNTGTWAYSD